jgi:hypothetical protein
MTPKTSPAGPAADLPVTPATWDRAYADVLFAHIDRLNDVCPKTDPLERIAQSLREGFDRVAATDPAMNRDDAWRAAQAGQPWPAPGQVLWYPEGNLATRRAARVMLTFRGRDERTWCLLELEDGYRVLPALGLHADKDGPSYFQQALANPDFARQFMQQAGLLDAKGEWMPQFQPPEDEGGSEVGSEGG